MASIRELAGMVLLAVVLALAVPQTCWASDPISDALLDGAEEKAKSVIARAEAAGDAFAKSLGEQALATIEALRAAIASSVGAIEDSVSKSQQAIFNDVNRTLDRLERDEKIIATDATKLTATWATQIKNLPFTNHAPEVMMYEPRVVVANGPAIVPLRIIGPKLAVADPSLGKDGARIPLDRATDQELVAKLDRATLIFHESEPTYVTYTLTLDRAVKTWWKPWSWLASDPVERDITMMLMPHTLARFRIDPKLNSSTVERKNWTKEVGGKGKDAPMYIPVPVPPLDAEAGWLIDTGKLLKDGLSFAGIGGDNAQCVGMVTDKLTTNTLLFHIQHGHRTSNLGKKSDSWVNCRLTIPLIKTTPIVIDGEAIEGTIGWTADVRKTLPDSLNSYTINIALFDGKEYILDAESAVPYGLVEIERGDDYVQFRPRPPSDF